MTNQEQEFIKVHHSIVDAVISIVANLFIIEVMNKNGCKVFQHKGVNVDINTDLLVLGLTVNLKDYFIEEFGEREGLNRAYGALKTMYFDAIDKKPMELSPEGREMLNVLLIAVVDDYLLDASSTIH